MIKQNVAQLKQALENSTNETDPIEQIDELTNTGIKKLIGHNSNALNDLKRTSRVLLKLLTNKDSFIPRRL